MDKVMLEMVGEASRNSRLKKVMHQYQLMIHDHVAEVIKRKADEGFVRKGIVVDGLAVNRMLAMNESVSKKAWVKMVRAIIDSSS